MEETALPDPAPRPPAESTGTVWPVLSPDALYGLAGDVVRTIGPHTEADPAALLMQFLTAIGNVLGRDLYATAEDARHGLNLNVVLVGDSSKGRKGTSWARIKSLISRTDDRWSRKQIVSGLSSGEGLIERFEYIDEDDNVNEQTAPCGSERICFRAEGDGTSWEYALARHPRPMGLSRSHPDSDPEEKQAVHYQPAPEHHRAYHPRRVIKTAMRNGDDERLRESVPVCFSQTQPLSAGREQYPGGQASHSGRTDVQGSDGLEGPGATIQAR